MICNNLDLGQGQPPRVPQAGVLLGNVLVTGAREFSFLLGGQTIRMQGEVWIEAFAAIGGFAAKSPQAAEYLASQLQEMAGNPDLNPVYVQFASGAGVITLTPDDGWYHLDNVTPNKYALNWTGFLQVKFSLTKVSAGAPTRTGIWSAGAQLGTSYTGLGGGTNWHAYPVGSTTVLNPPIGSVTRTGGEGAVPVVVSPLANPSPVVLSAATANWFKGGCRVYDANSLLVTNPVPTNGSFVHASWVEVKGTDHRFAGDIVVTNGLILLAFVPTAANQVAVCYLWNTALSTPAWQQFAILGYSDVSASSNGVLQQASLLRLGGEELAIRLTVNVSATGNAADITLRLQRGSYAVRVDFKPLTYNNTNSYGLSLTTPANVKAAWTSAGATDPTIPTNAGWNGSVSTDYGYGGAFINSATYPFILGWLYQNTPGFQGAVINAGNILPLGDNTGPTQNSISTYGFYAVPFGTQTTTTDKLQAEAESGTLSGGVVSLASAAESNGNVAKVPSGTAGQIPAPTPLSGMTDTGAGAGTLNKGGYTVVQTWTDASGETTSSGDNTSSLTVTLAQTGNIITSSASTSVAPTLPSGSTAGTCLVAFVSYQNSTPVSDVYSAPANWVNLTTVTDSFTGRGTVRNEVWVYLNNPGGISSATFTTPNNRNHQAEMSEWNNVILASVLDTSDTTRGLLDSNTGTTLPFTTSANVSQSGDVAIAGWMQWSLSSSGTFTTPSGWTRLKDNGGTGGVQVDFEYKIGPSTGSPLSVTLTSSTTTFLAAGTLVCLKPAPTNTVFLTTNGDKLHVPLITGAPATTTNGKFYFTAAVSPMNAGLAATQAVAASQIAAFDIVANPGSAVSPPSTNTTAGTPGVDLFGTSFIPPAGAYNLWFRMKVTSAAGANNEMKFGLWDTTNGAYVSSTIWRPNQLTTSYAWYKVASLVTPISGHNMQYRLNTNAATGTDWFIDQALFVPITALAGVNFPQDHWQQWIYDRTTKLILD